MKTYYKVNHNLNYISNVDFLTSQCIFSDKDFVTADKILNEEIISLDYGDFSPSFKMKSEKNNNTLYVIAGNIGSGKSTLLQILIENSFFQGNPILVLEDIYKLKFFNQVEKLKEAYLYAKTLVIKKIYELIHNGSSFILELVPSSISKINMIRQIKQFGYKVILIYSITKSINVNLNRTKNRMNLGGDFISEEKVVSREILVDKFIDELFFISNEYYIFESDDMCFQLINHCSRNGE